MAFTYSQWWKPESRGSLRPSGSCCESICRNCVVVMGPSLQHSGSLHLHLGRLLWWVCCLGIRIPGCIRPVDWTLWWVCCLGIMNPGYIIPVDWTLWWVHCLGVMVPECIRPVGWTLWWVCCLEIMIPKWITTGCLNFFYSDLLFPMKFLTHPDY